MKIRHSGPENEKINGTIFNFHEKNTICYDMIKKSGQFCACEQKKKRERRENG